jgi:integrase
VRLSNQSNRNPGSRDRRDRRPSTERGIEPVWSGGRWRFRARVQVGRRATVGRLRDDQAEAAADRALLEQHGSAFRAAKGLRLGEALDQVLAEARRRGVAQNTLRALRSHARWLGTRLGVDRPLGELAVAEIVQDLVVEARQAGRAASTIWRKDCRLLSQAFGLAELPDPVPAVRKAMQRTALGKIVEPRLVFFDLAEIGPLIDRIRSGPVAVGRVAPDPETRAADADLIEFLATSGARVGEACRIRVEDVDLARGRVDVLAAKDRSHPRALPVPARARPALQRLVERARAATAAGENPGRLLLPDGERGLEAVFRRWRSLLEEGRLSGRNLRRSYLTGLATAGASLNAIMALAGHRRASTTSRYVAAAGRELDDLAERVGAAIGAAAEVPGAD